MNPTIPLKELEPEAQHVLAEAIRIEGRQEGKRLRLLAMLWLHIAFKLGIKPWELKDQSSQAHRIITAAWMPPATNLLGMPTSIVRQWVKDVATHAVKLHTQALEDRANEMAGQAVPLF